MRAISRGNIIAAEELRHFGATFSNTDKFEILFKAASSGNTSSIIRLVNEIINDHSIGALSWGLFVDNGRYDLLEELLKVMPENMRNSCVELSIHHVIDGCKINFVKLLLKNVRKEYLEDEGGVLLDLAISKYLGNEEAYEMITVLRENGVKPSMRFMKCFSLFAGNSKRV